MEETTEPEPKSGRPAKRGGQAKQNGAKKKGESNHLAASPEPENDAPKADTTRLTYQGGVSDESVLAEGRWVVQASLIGTVAFVIAAVAAVASPDSVGRAFAIISLALFGVGCLTFLGGFWHAVQRSRVDDISLGGMLVVTHHGLPPAKARKPLLGAIAVQTVVSYVAAGIRPFTEVAFGILVPMFGLGLACWWGATLGRFPPRPSSERE